MTNVTISEIPEYISINSTSRFIVQNNISSSINKMIKLSLTTNFTYKNLFTEIFLAIIYRIVNESTNHVRTWFIIQVSNCFLIGHSCTITEIPANVSNMIWNTCPELTYHRRINIIFKSYPTLSASTFYENFLW